MEMCARCHKRVAVVYVTRIDGDKSVNEGICLKCAKELGIKQVDDILKKMGIDDDALDQMDEEMSSLIASDDTNDADEPEEGEEGRAPAINLGRLFGGLSNPNPLNDEGEVKPKQKNGKQKKQDRKYLETYCRNLTNAAKEGKLDRVIGRDRELGRMMQILCRRQKNNPCLIGEPGVGKTAIAEALALKIAAGEVPVKLLDKEVHLVDLTSIVAGTQFRGQFESRMKGLIEEVKALGNIILVIDEVHSIAGAGDAEGSMNAANILKPALSRGEIQVIGATTLAEYRKYIEKDSALERRFQPIIVDEPSIQDSIEILTGIKKYYEDFHGITISDEMVRKTVVLSERYIQDRFLPDKAIDLLDESASYVALHSPIIHETETLSRQLEKLNDEKAELEEKIKSEEQPENAVYQRLAELKSEQMQKQEQFETLSAQRDEVSLTVEDLARVIEIWTGIPASSISETEFEKIDKLKARLSEHIIGQDHAIDVVVRAIKRNRAGVSYIRKPVSFIFAGPTGVGKTELVKQLSADLFHSPEALIRLDMSEFMEKHSVSKIIGSPPGYVGYDEAGQLTEKIRRKPYSVILFDEIEKAHPDVLNILLQILDDGRLTDAHGKEVNFENTIIVMTTNAGSDGGSKTAGFGTIDKSMDENNTEKALLGFLRPEFINRVDEIVTFRHLSREDFKKIAQIMLGQLFNNLREKEIVFVYTDEALSFIADQAYSVRYGARNLRRYIQTHVEDQAAQLIINHYNDPIHTVSVTLQTDENGTQSLLIQ